MINSVNKGGLCWIKPRFDCIDWEILRGCARLCPKAGNVRDLAVQTNNRHLCHAEEYGSWILGTEDDRCPNC
jgi:hypothetical protein